MALETTPPTPTESATEKPPRKTASAKPASRGLSKRAAAKDSATPIDNELIRETDGVAYIQESALHPSLDDEDGLDPRMKGLVESVLTVS
jgi:hypothetical protein